MSVHTVIRPENQAVPTPSAPGFERADVECKACSRVFRVWKWRRATVSIAHVIGGSHIERHGPR